MNRFIIQPITGLYPEEVIRTQDKFKKMFPDDNLKFMDPEPINKGPFYTDVCISKYLPRMRTCKEITIAPGFNYCPVARKLITKFIEVDPIVTVGSYNYGMN